MCAEVAACAAPHRPDGPVVGREGQGGRTAECERERGHREPRSASVAAEVVPRLLPKYPETILFSLGGDGHGLTLSLGSGSTPTCAPMPAVHS